MEDVKNKFISIIKDSISKDNNLKDHLIDILDISKEGLYRRIKGDINFSFGEIAKIAKELDLSLDNIIGIKKQNGVQFKLLYPITKSIEEVLQESMEERAIAFSNHNINRDENLSSKMATNTLPLALYCRHKYISKFLLYKWIYQTKKVLPNYSFSEYTLPKNTSELLKRYAYKTSGHKSPLTLIIDEKMYNSIIIDIEFFYKRNLIDDEAMRLLKQDLLESLEALESFSIKGTRPGGGPVEIYISSINLDRTYIFIQSEKQKYSEFVLYSMTSLISTDEAICSIQEAWIDSLKKYSTLITQCNEIQRHSFFCSQRELINNIID